MAIAGKVAITLSTENGGVWSADVTYDRLVAVKHNNNLYISRKTVANVEPPNDEFWFLALEGFGGEDVEALIDRMNELSGLIQAIINGTTPVGNALTLDGHEAEDFAEKTDLANYLPKSGGTVEANNTAPLGVKVTANNIGAWFKFANNNGSLGHYGFKADGTPNIIMRDDLTEYDLLHTGNKPTGSYTGNGDATSRTVNTGGIGQFLLIFNTSIGHAIVSICGASVFLPDGTVQYVSSNEAKYDNGILTLATAGALNLSGAGYYYNVP